MAQKKEIQNKKMKVKDLPPKKDAKGGGGVHLQGGGIAAGGGKLLGGGGGHAQGGGGGHAQGGGRPQGGQGAN